MNAISSHRSKFFFLISAGFVLYLILFSAFALFHFYDQNELIDSHGCQIGQWVQQGQGTLFSILLVSTVLGFVFTHSWPLSLFPCQVVPISLSARAPPRFMP